MLYEAYYPSEGSDNHPVQIFYGFVQEGFEKDYQLTLVVFYPKLTGTSLFNLSDEIKAGLANFLLQKHVYGVKASFIRVAFVCPHLNEQDFYAESWGVDVFENYAQEQIEQRPKKFLDKIFNSGFINISINSRNLTIGLTEKITLIDEKNLDTDETAYLLNRLKEVNYGDFNKVFGE
ncbi:hypothetical protein [Acinetobacter baumannii]|uniref:hypothetical protein n=1 Tax=Acinetobacter baumannii TaxID=470 RepID=UPI00215E9575|nr:hypothetical protein [Acinetobacter baumannii]MDQ8961557.1 hypothetical protein [Acinetobacter baumannii]